MNASDFWFGLVAGIPVGFIVAAWVAYRAKERARAKLQNSFQGIRSGLVDLINSIKDIDEVKITIRDETSEEDPEPATSSRPAKDLH